MFFLIDLAEKIEEKRFAMAIILESFLLGCLSKAKLHACNVLNHKFSSLYFVLAIAALSIILRSFRDVGYESMALIDVTNMMLSGKSYFVDFMDNNLPLFCYFNSIPILFAKYFGLSEVVIVDWWSNLIGGVGIFFSAKILLKSEFLRKNRVFVNLIIAGFAVGYFLRVFTFSYGEFGTKSSYFLIFSYIYFSYFVIEDNLINRFDQVIIGLVAALLFCLKPHYGFIVIAVEFYRIFKGQGLHQKIQLAFCLRNYVTLLILSAYVALMVFYYPEFISSQNAKDYSLGVLINDFYPSFLVIFLLYFFVSRDLFLEKILFFSCCFILIPVFEMIGGYDQRFTAYSVFLPALLVILVYLVNQNLLNLKKSWFLFGISFLVMQFETQMVFELLVNLVFLWWVFVLVDVFYYKRRDFGVLNISKALDAVIFWLILVLLTYISMYNLFYDKYYIISWVLSLLMFAYYVFSHEKYSEGKGFSKVSSVIIIIVSGYVFSLYWQGVVGLKNYQSVKYKTPNYVSEQIIKSASQKIGDFIMISDNLADSYPLRKVTNFGYQDPMIFSYESLYQFSPKADDKFLLDSIKKKISDPENKTIFIKKADLCSIGFLEFYFRDLEFKKNFLDNYEFYNRIIEVEEKSLDENLYVGEFYDEENIRELTNIISDYEVYVRRK